MSNVDTAWLHMEELVNQMTITAVLTFSEPLAEEDLRRVIRERFLSFDRFHQRVRGGRSFQNPRWETDPHFDLDHHLRVTQLPAPGDKAQLQELASALMSRPLDFARPLWEFHLVEGYEEGAAVIMRLHHCIADGITLVRVLLSLTDARADAPPGGVPGENMADALAGAGNGGRNGAAQVHPSWAKRAVSALKRVGKKGARAVELAARGVGVLGKLAWPTPDPHTPLRGALGRTKKAAWSDPVALADVKAIGRVLGGTVNDVLMTAVTGAVRRYLQGRGEDTTGLDVRAAMPVNLRPLDAPLEMGNGFGLIFLSLPVGVIDPVERLETLRRRMDRLKRSPEAPILLKILSLIGATTRTVEDLVVTYLARKVTAVATNVPGPQQKLYMAGAPMETLMAWVPQAGRVGLGTSVISYDGEVRLGVATDARIAPDPEAVVEAFYHEFDALLEHVPPGERAAAAEEAKSDDYTDASTEKEEPPKDRGTQDPSPGAPAGPDRCQATTQAGAQCKLPAQDGARFCHVHR
jgi:WS/DGAT/MGAT family acyltransferase